MGDRQAGNKDIDIVYRTRQKAFAFACLVIKNRAPQKEPGRGKKTITVYA